MLICSTDVHWEKKSKLSTDEYKKLNPTGSSAGRTYGTAKLHKSDRNDKVDKLPLHQIGSKIGTTYQLAKCFSNYCHHEAKVNTLCKALQSLWNI